MGVPSLFSWLQRRFPGVVWRTDKTDECDYLYVDANSIIHNATHPSDRAAPEHEDDMLLDISKYLDYVIKTIKPKQLVFIAIDGVAPQAKINQQRSRRYNAAEEKKQYEEDKKQFLIKAHENNVYHYEKLKGANDWDSNTITPGTEFMARLDKYLHAALLRKLKEDPFYAELDIIFSPSSVPGEGEHKAMDFIRSQRQQPDYIPVRHCFYGPDADLIMLALATHEEDFRILREDPQEKRTARCSICHEYGHSSRKCATVPHDWIHLQKYSHEDWTPPRMLWFDVWALRQKLREELQIDDITVNGKLISVPRDFERQINDFILLVVLCGNDFLPALTLPDFDIHNDAISKIIAAWKKACRVSLGYIVSRGEIRIDRLRELFRQLADLEGQPPDHQEFDVMANLPFKEPSQTPDLAMTGNRAKMFMPPQNKSFGTTSDLALLDIPIANEGRVRVKESAGPDGDFSGGTGDGNQPLGLFKDKKDYYLEKFGEQGKDERFIRRMIARYVEGLSWVMHYYCKGCPSWTWYYPYYYAPFPSDTAGIASYVQPNWPASAVGQAMKPFYQLMSVFPPASAAAVPAPFRKEMLDPKSLLLNFYPTEWEVDKNGKAQEWKWILKLPFIDLDQLFMVLDPIWNDASNWTSAELERNKVGTMFLLTHKDNPRYKDLLSLYTDPRMQGKVKSVPGRQGSTLAGFTKYNQLSTKAIASNEWSERDPAAISATYMLPEPSADYEYWKKHPKQRPVKRHRKVVFRLKKPENKIAKAWVGTNVGRSAHDVAEEMAEERRTGVKKVFHNYFAVQEEEDDAAYSQTPALPLDDDFSDALLCRFKPSKHDAEPVAADWEASLEDDADDRVHAQADDVRGLVSSFMRQTSLAAGDEMDWKPAQDVLDGQPGPYREGAFSGTAYRARPTVPSHASPGNGSGSFAPPVPQRNSYGYTAHVPQKKKAAHSDDEDDSFDSDDSDAVEKKKQQRKRFKKHKEKPKLVVKEEDLEEW